MALAPQSITTAPSLGRIPRDGLLRAHHEPIVDLDAGDVVAFEALARRPAGSALERPDLLFDAARRAGRLVELDWACRVAAVRGAMDAGFVLTYKRDLVIDVASALLARIAPA